jgi:hypothetical protein
VIFVGGAVFMWRRRQRSRNGDDDVAMDLQPRGASAGGEISFRSGWTGLGRSALANDGTSGSGGYVNGNGNGNGNGNQAVLFFKPVYADDQMQQSYPEQRMQVNVSNETVNYLCFIAYLSFF